MYVCFLNEHDIRIWVTTILFTYFMMAVSHNILLLGYKIIY